MALNSYLCEVRVKVQLVVPKSDDRTSGEQIRRSHGAPFDKRVDMNVLPRWRDGKKESKKEKAKDYTD